MATEGSVPDHYKTFTAALTAIQSQYAESVESDRMVYGAINGMLQTLDPHSSFMDPRTYAQMRERQEGRTCNIGTTEYNLALGERRALSARTYLVSLGLPADRLRTVSYGKEFPFDPGHNETAWANNRRAQFVLTSK